MSTDYLFFLSNSPSEERKSPPIAIELNGRALGLPTPHLTRYMHYEAIIHWRCTVFSWIKNGTAPKPRLTCNYHAQVYLSRSQ